MLFFLLAYDVVRITLYRLSYIVKSDYFCLETFMVSTVIPFFHIQIDSGCRFPF